MTGSLEMPDKPIAALAVPTENGRPAVLVILIVYRVTLSSRKDDQIIISKAEDHIAAEQREIVSRITQLSRPIIALWVVSGILLMASAGMWIYQGLKSF